MTRSSRRADVYALGAILYHHVVAGAIPHEGTTLEEMVQRVAIGQVRPLTEREPRRSTRPRAAIVTKVRWYRSEADLLCYANAQGFADDVRRFLNGQLVGSPQLPGRPSCSGGGFADAVPP